MVGAEGKPACFCSPTGKTGCKPGLECQPLKEGGAGCFCSVENQTGCEAGLACEETQGSNTACYTPISVAGRVFDLQTGAGIENAHVVARDVNNASKSGVAVTDAEGHYSLPVPSPRDPDGKPLPNEIMLRADAQGYLTFPLPPRVALPFDVSTATGDPPVLSSSVTDIGLIDLPNPATLGAVAGKVLADTPRGTLVVAGGATGVADTDGAYTVFNVPAGSVTVNGYKVGLQLDSATAEVKAGETTLDVDLAWLRAATATVSGQVQIVNPGAGKATSVILVVEDTFIENTASGQAPPGLRVGDVTGAFSIPAVPDGNYVVLAAFENDFLIRDPDQSIGGTSLVRVSVKGVNVTLSEGFKVTGALDVVSPDKEEVVSGTPSFVWVDDSSEDHYEIAVFDAFGHLVWEKDDVPSVSGSKNVTVEYGGPALESGMLYQFRATSIKGGGSAISRTEDLRGVFLYQ